jgi:spartin
MSAGHSEPQVLYSVNNIRAFHVQDGREDEITTSGPQTLSLLMVPTSSPFADLSSANPTSEAQEEDFYLHLHLPPELDQPLPATTQIYHKPPSSYLIPRWDLGPDSGAFTRIAFPSIGTGPGKVSQEEIDTFETILAQCTAFLERAAPPSSHGKYDPSSYEPGQGYISSSTGRAPAYGDEKHSSHGHGQIVLIDEENGSVVGELQGGYNINEAPGIYPGSKTPVEIQLPAEGAGNTIQIGPVPEDYLETSRHPAYAKSTIVQSSARASRLLVTGSTYVANAMTSGASNFQSKTEPNPKPMTFSPTTQANLRRIHTFTQSAAGFSAKTVGQVGRVAQNFGAKMAGKGDKQKRGYDKDGNVDSGYKPGILNKSMIAFSTIADGIDHAGRQLLASGSAAATNVVNHKYGTEAGDATRSLTGGIKNVGLVYIDAVGVSRRAVLKSVAKGMVVGRMPNGQSLVVGAGDGGVMPGEEQHPYDMKRVGTNQSQTAYSVYESPQPSRTDLPGYNAGQIEGYGAQGALPPAYGTPGVGDGIEGQRAVRDQKR